MTEIDWDIGLPEFTNQSGFGETRANAKLETEMDSGPNLQRSLFTAVPVRFSIQITLTSAQVDIFDVFYTTTCKNGTLPFNWVHPRKTTQAVEMRFVGELPSTTAFAYNAFVTTFTVEVLP
jgi:hypothetical protein